MRTRLTRNDQEQIIKGGGSIMYEGRVISRIADLPDSAQSVQSEDDRTRQLNELEIEYTRLKQRREAVEKAPVSPPANTGPGHLRPQVVSGGASADVAARMTGGSAPTTGKPTGGAGGPAPFDPTVNTNNTDIGGDTGGNAGDNEVIVPARGDLPEYKWKQLKGKTAQELLSMPGIGQGSLDKITDHARSIGDKETGKGS